MASQNQTHNGLSVYGTDGEEYYPDPRNGTGHPEVGNWFIGTGLRFYLDTSKPELMVYLGDIRHPRQKNQAFAVYKGSNSSSIFSDFEHHVSEQLVEAENWNIIEQTTASDPKSIFDFVLRKPGKEFHPRRIDQYTNHEPDLIRRSLRVDNANHEVEPLEVIARDYHIAAELVHGHSDVDPIQIDIYDNQDVHPPDNVDLAIKVEPGPYEVMVPDQTQEHLSVIEQRVSNHRAKERKEQTISAIHSHAEKDDDIQIVSEAVETGFEKYYSPIEVIPTREYNRLQNEVETKQQKFQEARADLSAVQSRLESEQQQVTYLRRKAKVAKSIEKFARGGNIRIVLLVSFVWLLVISTILFSFGIIQIPDVIGWASDQIP